MNRSLSAFSSDFRHWILHRFTSKADQCSIERTRSSCSSQSHLAIAMQSSAHVRVSHNSINQNYINFLINYHALLPIKLPDRRHTNTQSTDWLWLVGIESQWDISQSVTKSSGMCVSVPWTEMAHVVNRLATAATATYDGVPLKIHKPLNPTAPACLPARPCLGLYGLQRFPRKWVSFWARHDSQFMHRPEQ